MDPELCHTSDVLQTDDRSTLTSQPDDLPTSKCFICDSSRLQGKITSDDSGEDTTNILRILCQLLRVSWDIFANYGDPDLPFCPQCTSEVMGLIDLREQLVKLETEMVQRLRELEVGIAMSGDQEVTEEDTVRSCFRQQVVEQHNAKQLLRRKIVEQSTVSCPDVKTEPDQMHVIEVEPAFVQLHLGLTRFNLSEEVAPGQTDVDLDGQSWLSTRHGPLTRLRLSGGITHPPHTEKEAIIQSPGSDFEADLNEDQKSCGSPDSNSDLEGKPEKSSQPTPVRKRAAEKVTVEPTRSSDTDSEAKSTNESSSDDSSDEEEQHQRQKKSRNNRHEPSRHSQTVPHLRRKKKPKQCQVIRTWPPEDFSNIKVTENGRKFYEDIEILCIPDDPVRGFVLKCGSCEKTIDKSNATAQKRDAMKLMQMHIKAYHLNAYQCKECGKSLHNHRRLILHMETQHPPGGKPARPVRGFGKQRIPSELERCKDGSVKFKEIHILRLDLESCGDFNLHCGMCSKVCNKSVAYRSKQCPYRQMMKHIMAYHLKAFSCSTCGKSFRCKVTLQKHVEKNHSDNPPESCCDICGRPISGEGYMRKHMFTHKNIEEQASARAAGEQGPTTYRQLMEKRKALGLGPSYQCSECGKTFHFGANLRRHEFVHKKDIKEHKCEQCGKMYNTAENLKSHVKYIHDTERVHKKYRCSYCPKWFVSKSPWEKHERTHTKHIPYYCPMCNKGFSLKQSMMNHVRNKKCAGGTSTQGVAKSSVHGKKAKVTLPTTMAPSHPHPPPQQNLELCLQDHLMGTVPPQELGANAPPAHRNTFPAPTPITVPFPFPNYSGPFGVAQNFTPQQFNNYM